MRSTNVWPARSRPAMPPPTGQGRPRQGLGALVAACALAIGLGMPGAARADFSETLSIINTNPASTGNFGTVTVKDTGTNQVTIEFKVNPALNGGLERIGEVAFNTDVVLADGDFAGPNNWTLSNKSAAAGNNKNPEDGFGKFDVSFTGNSNADRLNDVVIVITHAGLTS